MPAVTTSADQTTEDREPCPVGSPQALSPTDEKVLVVLLASTGKVMSRETLTRLAGLDSASVRRVDSSIVALRRILGTGSITTVRRRGWFLTEDGARSARRFVE